MRNTAVTVIILLTAFFVYFMSESLLRQAAVANIDSSTVSVDSLVSKLPESWRERINYKMEMGRLLDTVIKAKTDGERVTALLNLADMEQNQKEKERIYRDVLSAYPKFQESLRAYLYFLLCGDKRSEVSITQYQAYIKKFPQLEQCQAWMGGYQKLERLKSPPEEILKYLEPLMSLQPEYREYGNLYKIISGLGHRLDLPELRDNATKMESDCRSLPSIEKVLNDRQKKLEESLKSQNQK